MDAPLPTAHTLVAGLLSSLTPVWSLLEQTSPLTAGSIKQGRKAKS